MLQEGGLYPGVRPLEVLQLFAAYYDDPDDPERCSTSSGSTTRRHTLVRRLSGGQQQRLSLALRAGRQARRSCSSTSRPRAWTRTPGPTTWAIVRELRDRGDDRRAHHARDGRGRAPVRPGRDHRPRAPRRAATRPAELTDARARPTRPRFTTVTGLAGRRARRAALGLGHGDRCASCARASTSSTRAAYAGAASPTLTAWLREQGALLQRAAGRAPLARRRVPPPHRRRTLVTRGR